MYDIADLLSEVREATDQTWFIGGTDVTERSGSTVSLRLHIRADLFIHVFMGESSGSLYFALIEMDQRIFGIDRECGEWHRHPYENPHIHEPMEQGLEPKPLLKFLSRVEKLLLEQDLL